MFCNHTDIQSAFDCGYSGETSKQAGLAARSAPCPAAAVLLPRCRISAVPMSPGEPTACSSPYPKREEKITPKREGLQVPRSQAQLEDTAEKTALRRGTRYLPPRTITTCPRGKAAFEEKQIATPTSWLRAARRLLHRAPLLATPAAPSPAPAPCGAAPSRQHRHQRGAAPSRRHQHRHQRGAAPSHRHQFPLLAWLSGETTGLSCLLSAGDAASAVGAACCSRGDGARLSQSKLRFLPTACFSTSLRASWKLSRGFQCFHSCFAGREAKNDGRGGHVTRFVTGSAARDRSPPRCRDPQGQLPQPSTAQQPTPPRTESPLKRIINFQLRSA